MSIFHIISFLILFISSLGQDGGIKIAINEKIMKYIIHYFSDDINSNIKHIYI